MTRQVGKGDKQRPGDRKAYAENWDKIFKPKTRCGKVEP